MFPTPQAVTYDPLADIIEAEKQYRSTHTTSPALLNNISSMLWVNIERELLNDFQTRMSPYFSRDSSKAGLFATTEEALGKEMRAEEVPENKISAQLAKQMKQASQFQTLFAGAKEALEKGQLDQAALLFKNFSSPLIDTDQKLPPFLQDGLTKSLDGLFVQGKDGKSVGDLLLLTLLSEQAATAKKAGARGDLLQENLKSTLDRIADNNPPSAFSVVAQELKERPDFQQLMQKIATSPEDQMEELQNNLAALLGEISDKTEVRLSLATTQKMLTKETDPDNFYELYLKSCEDERAKNSIMDPFKKLGFSNLEDLISIFTSIATPDMRDDLQKLIDLLNRKIPTTPEEISQLKNSFSSLFEMLGRIFPELPPDEKSELLVQMKKLLDKNIQVLEESELNCQKDITDLETQSQEIKDASGLIGQFNQTMNAAKEKGSLTFTEIQENISTLLNLISNYRLQSKDNKKLFAPFLDTLKDLNFNGKPFSELQASGQVTLWLREFSRDYPGGSIDQFKSFLTSKLTSLKQVAPTHPFLNELMGNHETLQATPHFPNCPSAFGKPFVKEEAEVLAPNPEMPKAMESTYRPTPAQATRIQSTASTCQSRLTVSHDENQSNIRATRKGFSVISSAKRHTYSAKSDIQMKQYLSSAPSVPSGDINPADQFINFINEYMGKETTYLINTADLLAAYNDGVNYFNNILGAITDFSGATKMLDLTTFLQSIADASNQGYFKNGTNTAVFQKMITQATALISNLMNELNEMMPGGKNDLQALITKIKGQMDDASPDVQAIYQNMLDILTPLAYSQAYGPTPLEIMKNNLRVLSGYLNNMQLSPYTPSGSTTATDFQITMKDGRSFSMTDFCTVTTNATTGDSKHDPKWWPSIDDFYNDINNGVTNNSNLSQQQQIMLSLTMTTINQEWTVVSTCMSTIYKTYSTLTSGIFPH